MSSRISQSEPPSADALRLEELEAFWDQITMCMQTSLSPWPPSTASMVNAVITMQKRLSKMDVEVSRALEILAQGTNGIRRIGVESLEDACIRVMAALNQAPNTKVSSEASPEYVDPSPWPQVFGVGTDA